MRKEMSIFQMKKRKDKTPRKKRQPSETKVIYLIKSSK